MCVKVGYLGVLALPGGIAATGLPKVSETLLREYEQADVSVRVEAFTLTSSVDDEVSLARGKVTYHYIPCKSRGKTMTFYLQEVARLKKRLRSLHVDLVHGQPGPEYMLATVGCGLPHVITIHGLPWQGGSTVPISQPGQRAVALVREFLHRRAIKRAQNIISISPYVRDYLRGWARGCVWTIPNPIDERFFQLSPPLRSGLRIICVGTVSERKNQQLLVEACARLEQMSIDFECRIIGLSRANSAVAQLIKRKQLQHREKITGAIPAEALLDHYGWANVVVLPSRGETSPLSLIQGMASGGCVLGAAAAGIPVLLGDGEFGTLFSPENADELCRKLADLFERPQHYWQIAAVAADHARSTFRSASVAQKTLALYQQIAQKSNL